MQLRNSPLTAWIRLVFKKLRVIQLLEKFAAFYESPLIRCTRRAHHWNSVLSRATVCRKRSLGNTFGNKIEGKDVSVFNPLNAQLNPICHLLALLGAHYIFHVSGLRVKERHATKVYGVEIQLHPFSTRSQTCEKRLLVSLMSVCPSVCAPVLPHGTSWLSLARFLGQTTFEYCS